MKKITLAEAEKASTYMRKQAAAEAEKRELLERFEKPSGVSDEERPKRAASSSSAPWTHDAMWGLAARPNVPGIQPEPETRFRVSHDWKIP
jgi:hypothetical protein